jgi:hypothetical protein
MGKGSARKFRKSSAAATGTSGGAFTMAAESAFTRHRNECSRWIRIGVHVRPEYATSTRVALTTNVKELGCWIILSKRMEVGSARRCWGCIGGVYLHALTAPKVILLAKSAEPEICRVFRWKRSDESGDHLNLSDFASSIKCAGDPGEGGRYRTQLCRPPLHCVGGLRRSCYQIKSSACSFF